MLTTKAELTARLLEESERAIKRNIPGVALGLTVARLIISSEYKPEEPKAPKLKNGEWQTGQPDTAPTPPPRVCPDCNGKGYRSILLFGGIVGHETCIFCQGLGTHKEENSK